jgi:NhaA family Na+:H+ antiporter
MATDIAFALGVLYVLGKRVPLGLKVFLSAFAIADDLGAAFIIALFYTREIVVGNLLISLVIIIAIAMMNLFWVRKTLPYAVLGVLLWFFILGSGVHATVAGIAVAMFIPARGKYETERFIDTVMQKLDEFRCPQDGCGYSILLDESHMNAVQGIEEACHDVETPLQRIGKALHPWVNFVVLPLFAFVNVGMPLGASEFSGALASPLSQGVFFGLLIGKPLGIGVFSYIAVRSGLAVLPEGTGWRQIIGAGMLGGIGFTMSLFISGLSFEAAGLAEQAKAGILMGSITAGTLGLSYLYIKSRRQGAR